MPKRAGRVLFWTPRILCILFALFLGLFALDVFDVPASLGEKLLGLLVHLVPVYIVAVVLLFSWRREWIGAIAYTALAVLYIVLDRGESHWSVYAGIPGPLFLLGVLFLLNWIYRSRLRQNKT